MSGRLASLGLAVLLLVGGVAAMLALADDFGRGLFAFIMCESVAALVAYYTLKDWKESTK